MYIFLIVLLLILPWPFYWWFMNIFKSTKENRVNLLLGRGLDRLVRKNRLTINEMDVFNNKIIGLDKKNLKIVLIEYKNNSVRAECFSLKEAESCSFDKEINQSTGRIEKVTMRLDFDPANKPVNFILYDATRESIYELPFLLGKAKYWKSKIQLYIPINRPEAQLKYAL